MALVRAAFLERPNRFVVRARLDGAARVEAHLADPGRLSELLVPGAELRLRPAPPGSRRATRYSVALVRAPGPRGSWVSVDTGLANRLAAGLLAGGLVRGVASGHGIRREVRSGDSRLDFLLERSGRRLWVEVKSVTLAERGIARFPDAPTARGRRHVEELARRVGDGDGAMVLFVVQRGDAREVRPHATLDPAFAAALRRAAAAGVLLRAARFRLDASGRARHAGPLPVRAARVE